MKTTALSMCAVSVVLLWASQATAQSMAAKAEAETESSDDLDWVAIPTLKFNDDAGFVYGIKTELVQQTKDARPHDWELQLKLNHSTRNRHEHRLQFDKTDFLGTGVRLGVLAQFFKIEDANYFGVGNRSKNTGNEKFHQYELSAPIFQINGRRKIRGDFFLGAGLGFYAAFVDFKEGTLIAQDRPIGADRDKPDQATIGLVYMGYDSRDNELTPRSGHLTEIYFKGTSDLVSTHGFYGLGLSQRSYFAFAEWAVLAQRIGVEHLDGEVPFYMMSIIGGSQPAFGLGGSYTHRGFVESRFIGRSKFLSNTELRFYLPRLWEDGICIGMGPFVDVSRVIDDNPSLSQLHPSAGAEITIDWKGAFLFRMDYAVSSEGGLFYIQGRHMF